MSVRNPWQVRLRVSPSWHRGWIDGVWGGIEHNPHDPTARTALRIRWAARHSCKRLRAERDAAREARDAFGNMVSDNIATIDELQERLSKALGLWSFELGAPKWDFLLEMAEKFARGRTSDYEQGIAEGLRRAAEVRTAARAVLDTLAAADPWGRQTEAEQWEHTCALKHLEDALASSEPCGDGETK